MVDRRGVVHPGPPIKRAWIASGVGLVTRRIRRICHRGSRHSPSQPREVTPGQVRCSHEAGGAWCRCAARSTPPSHSRVGWVAERTMVTDRPVCETRGACPFGPVGRTTRPTGRQRAPARVAWGGSWRLHNVDRPLAHARKPPDSSPAGHWAHDHGRDPAGCPGPGGGATTSRLPYRHARQRNRG